MATGSYMIDEDFTDNSITEFDTLKDNVVSNSVFFVVKKLLLYNDIECFKMSVLQKRDDELICRQWQYFDGRQCSIQRISKYNFQQYRIYLNKDDLKSYIIYKKLQSDKINDNNFGFDRL